MNICLLIVSCLMFCSILHIGDVVEMEGQMYSVVGVACHEMWFQMEISGEFVCCTRATLSNLISRNKFRVITSLSHHISELSCVERGVQGENLKEIGVFKNIDDFSSIVQTFAVMWTREEDELLIEVITCSLSFLGLVQTMFVFYLFHIAF